VINNSLNKIKKIIMQKLIKILMLSPIFYLLVVLIANCEVGLKLIEKTNLISNFEDSYGRVNLSDKYVNEIRSVMSKMNFDMPVNLKKMNSQALRIFGYYNAMAGYPMLFKIIPLNKPYIFVSESFFEDITKEEQVFLIGHELMHIFYKDPVWHAVIFNFVFISLIALFMFLIYNFNRINKIALTIIFILSWVIINLGKFAHCRYFEKRADLESMQILCSHEGCLKYLDRYEKFINVKSDDNSWLSDHPSNNQRRNYFK
jgi:Zn-dependent protease with chaperone function